MLFDLVLFATGVSAYGLCSRTNHRFAANLPTVNIVPTATRSITVNGTVAPVTVSGQVRVVDGCSFALVNAQISGPATIQFFGGRSESDNQSVRLTTDTVPTGNINATYTFIQTAGNWVNYNDFTQINFFDPASNAVIAQAVLPGSVSVTASATATRPASTGAAASSTSAAPSSVVTSGVESTTLGVAGILSLLMTLF